MLRIPHDAVWPCGWTVDVEALPSGRGRCRWAAGVLAVKAGLTVPQLGTTLAHEAVHASRGTAPRWRRAGEERVVHELAGRLLISPGVLASELEWSPDPRVIAFDLEVTDDLVEARLAGLDATEYAELWARTAHHREGA